MHTKESLTIGRDPAVCDMVFDQPAVSSRHCRLRRGNEGQIWLDDLGSANGTFIGDVRIPSQASQVVRVGDRIALGRHLIFVLEAGHVAALRVPSEKSVPVVSIPAAPQAAPTRAPPVSVVNIPAPEPAHAQSPAPVAQPKKTSKFAIWLSIGVTVFAVKLAIKTLHVRVPYVSSPEVLLDETVVLSEGSGRDLSFRAEGGATVAVDVKASPQPVNVYLMDDGDFAAFQKANANGIGEFRYYSVFSGKKITAMRRTADLPKGHWHIVVQRPNESLLVGDDTRASIHVTLE